MSLTATLIVRNEAAVLAACLQSIQPLVDEIVVVDTGSTDATLDIIRSFAIEPIAFAWCDDFSAARNTAIDHAHGDWLLYIDADERCRPIDGQQIRAELNDPSLLCSTVRFHPRTGFTAYREHRLIRRDPRIRFAGAMHETYLPAVQRLTAEGHGHIGATSLVMDHIGYDGDQSHKFDRNLRLLEKQIAVSPDRAYLHWHLGTIQRDLGQTAAAEASWAHGAARARQTDDRHPDAALCAIELAKLALLDGHDPQRWLAEIEERHPGNWMAHWLRGKAFLAKGDLAAAALVFEQLGAIDPATMVDDVAYDARIFGAGALAELGEAALDLHRFNESAHWFARAEALAPWALEFRVKRQLAQARARAA